MAFSGGGDSLALLLMVKAWGDAAGRPVLALTVDHGLQAESAAWARWCADRCDRLGVERRTLAWTGRKPLSGVADAARAARHGLVAEAARSGGAMVILMGHTADDLAENTAMRAEGVFINDPRPWAPSPVWPRGRGVFLLRPLLGLRRADLRRWLTARAETWLEDPANADPRQARARARATMALAEPPRRPMVCGWALMAAREEAAERRPPLSYRHGHGAFALDRRNLAPSALAMTLACAGGRESGPRSGALHRLLSRAGDFTATVAGARARAEGAVFHISREPGELSRFGRPEPLPLPVGEAVVWDGRFEILAKEPGLTVVPLAGRAGRLGEPARLALAEVPAWARPALPAVVDSSGEAHLPNLTPNPCVSARDLTGERFAAAIGAVGDEATAWRMAKGRPIT